MVFVDIIAHLLFDCKHFRAKTPMSKEETIKMEGKVEELLPNMNFSVVLENGMRVIAHLSGKMRMRNIRVYAGDAVTVEMSPYDLTKARIVYRQK